MPEILAQKLKLQNIFGNNPTTKVLTLLLSNQDKEYTITEICDKASVGRGVMYDGLLRFLLNEGLMTKSKEVGNYKLFKLNKESKKVKAIIELLNKIGK